MEFDEMKKMDAAARKLVLGETTHALQRARFSVAQRQLKNVRSVRAFRKTVARLKTAERQAQRTA